MFPLFNYNSLEKTAELRLKVKAAGKQNKINKFIFIDHHAYLKVTVKTVPEQGKANEAIIDFLSNEWKIKKVCFAITSGHKNNLKLLRIENIEQDYLNSILCSYI